MFTSFDMIYEYCGHVLEIYRGQVVANAMVDGCGKENNQQHMVKL